MSECVTPESTIDDIDIEVQAPTEFPLATSTPLEYAATHVFLPVELPDENDYTLENDLALVRAACFAAHAYSSYIRGISEEGRWRCITKMLDNLQALVRSERFDRDHIITQLRGMQTGDILTFHVRPQNAAIIFRRQENWTTYESFEVSPSRDTVEKTAGSLVCSYPCSVVELPNKVFDDGDFQSEFANFLSRPGSVDSKDIPTPSPHPQYITALLPGILRGVGRLADAARITKRIRDDVGQAENSNEGIDDQHYLGGNFGHRTFDKREPRDWRRSSLWLLIKVAIQTSLDRSPLGCTSYKRFLLFFLCTLAKDGNNANLSSDLLHLMASKILRRLSKLGSSTPDWLSQTALGTCAVLQETLDTRQRHLSSRPSPFRNPSQDELARDTQLSLLNSREYIRDALTDPGCQPSRTPFSPRHHLRGTIDDFLCSTGLSFFTEAYRADPDTTLYDVEWSVEQEIDDWLSRITNVDDACAQLATFLDEYIVASSYRNDDPEYASIRFLTMIELFVALDKLVVKEIPMLADYSPEIPVASMETLLLRKATSFHRLSSVYQYLSARWSRSYPKWSVLSSQFAEDSFPARYYDHSPQLQQLKECIVEDTKKNAAAYIGIPSKSEHTSPIRDKYQQHQMHDLAVEGTVSSRLPLPASLLHLKIVVFEIQCPAYFRIWRSAVAQILDYIRTDEGVPNLVSLSDVPELQPYFVDGKSPALPARDHIKLAYLYRDDSQPASRNIPELRYVVQRFQTLWIWRASDEIPHLPGGYSICNHCSSCRDLAKYVNYTTHTSNTVMGAQTDCPMDMSLDEFIAFAHLRSGGSLQWLNILHGLRGRTLNIRHHSLHFLLAHAVFEVGPLDLITNTWVWHQELQDSSFCNALLDALDSLFVDVGGGSIDGVLMSNIALLLTRVLATGSSDKVSDRAVALLRSVRWRTFNWVQELSYDLSMAPMNEERASFLLDMAATCRSTFDVDTQTTRGKVFYSAEDVDALLSCALFINALRPEQISDKYSLLLLKRDRRLSLVLEEILRDAIIADPSEYGVDLAVSKGFAVYQPGRAWQQLQYPNARWLTCQTETSMNRPSRPVHINLLNGSLLVDGQSLGTLLPEIRDTREFRQIFRDQGFFVVPSNLHGMDFMALSMSSERKVHFSLRGADLVVRAQCSQTNRIFQLIPSSVLRGDLPPMLIYDHVHWLDISTQVIEVRPLKQLWEQSSENWKIDCASGQYRMYRGRETLVDIRSPTWEMASNCFECLSNISDGLLSQSRNLLVTTHSIESVSMPRLTITLHRYGLSFVVNQQEELQSRDFKDMVYDENQYIGALFGLANLLVLRPKSQVTPFVPQAHIPRRVLIPNGFPKKHHDGGVRIDTGLFFHDSNEPLYYIYDVDTELGCLMGNGSPGSTRLLAYAHTMTSFHRPNPLTGQTGVQAGLRLLQSAECRSIMKLKALDDNSHWTSTAYPQINAAYEEIQKRYYWNHVDKAVCAPARKRAAQRAAYLFPSESAEQSYPEDVNIDRNYLTPESDVDLEDVAYAAASAICHWTANRPTIDTILYWAELWRSNVQAETAFLAPHPNAQGDPDPMQIVMNKIRDLLEIKEGSRREFQLLFLLPTVAYCSSSHQAAFLSMLIAFAKSDLGNPFIDANYNIFDGYRPTEQGVRDRIREFCVQQWWLYSSSGKHSVDATARNLLKDWPSETVPKISLDSRICNVARLTTSLQRLFISCHRNFKLKESLQNALIGPGLPAPQRVSSPRHILNERVRWQITLNQLFSERHAPKLPALRTTLRRDNERENNISEPLTDMKPTLNQLFSSPSLHTSTSFQREYLALLEMSAGTSKELQMTCGVTKDHIDALRKYFAECSMNYADALRIMKESLGPITNYEQALDRFGQWPPITADQLLRHLASTSAIKLPEQWKRCFVSLALLVLELQRARRLLRLALDGPEEEFVREMENDGCDGWNAEGYPDWLLIQIQGNFLIRRIQAETAIEMMHPKSKQNTVMQMNMGEGKSSVIIPIVSAALADGQQLARVIVPKALTVQMFELLVSRLGGFSNRPIYHLPFSRSSDDRWATSPGIDILHTLVSQCAFEQGILLVQPEHVVSLKLMSVEQQLHKDKLTTDQSSKPRRSIYKHIATAISLKSLPKSGIVGSMFRWLCRAPDHRIKDAARGTEYQIQLSGDTHGALDNASKWVDLQKWVHSCARDVLDESDEILHSRFQLIYTMGLQQYVDGYPDRWTITQQILRLVKEHTRTLSKNHPNSVEYECGPPGSFPHVRIVHASDLGRRLIPMIVEDVMAGRLPSFDFQQITPALRDAIRSFISDEDVLRVPDTVNRVEGYAKHSSQSHLWSGLLLLRGLLASNILLFALADRRWRVDYGLDLRPQQLGDDGRPVRQTSTMLAVPYRAKDVPVPNTQFGHPDITIILTCLSYYYTGLSEEQLRAAFEILLDQDDPYENYAFWIKECDHGSVPESLWKLREVNLRSSEQWDQVVYPLFARSQAAIDFYLSQVVFPKEAKEIPWKLCGSSWDLGEEREKLVTGFSGTNDGRWLLPMSVTQHDLDHQRGTNAKVLANLLQPANDFYMVTHQNGERLAAFEFLRLISSQRPEIHVLLDVGAQILDLSNRQVAAAWLDIVRDAPAAIYFNEDDELMVLTRNDITQPMLSSALSQQLDHCLVYLDHPHTRGTDIKFPAGSRAAVTLGPKLTKDALVQGCMRMRKLGHSHTVMFFAPLGVDQSIRAVTGKKDLNVPVTTVDIVCWTIHETWTDIQRRAPYWAQQGMNHKARYDAWTRFCNNGLTPEQLSDAWLLSDSKSLADLYAPRDGKAVHEDLSTVPGIQQRCRDLGVLSLCSPHLEEEQEREVSREREREREAELPPKARSAEHFLHQDVLSFVKTGVIPPLQPDGAFLPVFTMFEKTSAATREADVWSPFILATLDFCKTIKLESTRGTIDQYLRPIQWVLSSKMDRNHVLVLLSPFETDRLLPYIRASGYVHLHVYAPRTSRRMKPSDDLKLYSIPPLPSDWNPPWDLIDQLNVSAGQLYLRDYTSYLRLCRFLGIPMTESPDATVARRNLFNIPGSFQENEITFSGSPLPSVMALLAIRNRGRPFAHTHMGKILQAQLLTEKDFLRPTSGVGSDTRYDEQSHDDTLPKTPSLAHLDMVCDDLGSSALFRPQKRGLEVVEAPESPQKRLRT